MIIANILPAYRRLTVPADAPFELKPCGGNKGWGVFATRPIKNNALILQEAPAVRFTGSGHNITNDALEAAIRKLPLEKQQQIHSLCYNGNANAKFNNLVECFAENEFSTSWAGGGQAWGLFLLCSRFNHSCIPNARAPASSTKGLYTELYAIKDIAANEEITFCYLPDLKATLARDRQNILEFSCHCKACQPGTRFHYLSELRRRIIRGLLFLLRGQDRAAVMSSDSKPIIADTALRNTATAGNIPLSSRVVYLVLLAFLFEEEGLLCDFDLNNFNHMLGVFCQSFGDNANATIARAAMEEKTWLGKLSVAFWLYGKTDSSDQIVAGLVKENGFYLPRGAGWWIRRSGGGSLWL
jgi:hypothetical protein